MDNTVTIPRSEYEELKSIAEKYRELTKSQSAGGKMSSAKLTPEQRRERAKKAVEARIKKYGQARRADK